MSGCCHVCGQQVGVHLCTDGKQRLPLPLGSQEATGTEQAHVEHTNDRCCGQHGYHVMPHRGCVLR